MVRPVFGGSTDQSVVIRIIDSSDGTPEQAVEHDSSGISLWYRREGGSVTAITPAALAAANSAHSDGGIEHVDDGYYRLDLPDAAVAAAVSGVMVGGAVTGMVVIGCYVPIWAINPYVACLPNAAADAAGGLPVSDGGGLDLDAKLANTNEVTAARMGALTDWIDGGRLDLILDARASQASVNTIDDFLDTEIAAILAAVDTEVAAILEDTGTTIPATLATLATAAKLLAYVQLLARKDAGIATDNSTELDEINNDEGSGAGAYANTTDSQEAIRDKEADIEADTQDLQIQVGTDGAGLTAIPWNAAWDAEVQSEVADALAVYDPPTRTEATADKDEVLAAVAAVDDFVDTEVAAIKAKTDSLTFTVANQVDANMLAVNGSANGAARIERSAESQTLVTFDAGSTTTALIASSLVPASAVNDQWVGRSMVFPLDTTTAELRGQATTITDYVHATLTFTVTALTTAPASGDIAAIV